MNAPLPDETVRLLKRAKALIRKGWTQGPEAKARNGRRVSAESSVACKWCLYGAMVRAESDMGGAMAAFLKGWEALRRAAGEQPINFNEAPGRKKSEVLAAVDKAIRSIT